MAEKLKILFAEDERIFAKFIISKLEDSFDLTHRENGKLALEEFEKNSFDLCLFDIVMPEMDGIELIKRVRAKNPHIPIICLSGAKRATVDQAIAAGANAFAKKPDDIDLLEKKITDLMVPDVKEA